MDQPASSSKRGRALFITIGTMLLLGLLFLGWYIVWGQFEETTQDSYVHGNMVQLNSQVPGIVTKINAEETQFVKKGQIVVELDRTDPLIVFGRSKAELAESVRQVVELFENAISLRAELGVKKAELLQASWDFENRLPLVEPGAISKEEFEQALTNLEGAKNSLIQTKHAYLAALALVQNTTLTTHPLVRQSADNLREAFVNLRRCSIMAPTDGFIAMRNVQVGESVDVTTPLLAIIPLEDLWVEANFKEVHLKHVRIGQPVTMRADLYGRSVKYHGTVTGLSAGTGSAFSVLPPQNATGNWIKIVQRLPVRVDLNADELMRNPLMIGLSMHTHIDTHDRSGRILAEAKKELQPIYSTNIYPQQEWGADYIVKQTIRANADPAFIEEIEQMEW